MYRRQGTAGSQEHVFCIGGRGLPAPRLLDARVNNFYFVPLFLQVLALTCGKAVKIISLTRGSGNSQGTSAAIAICFHAAKMKFDTLQEEFDPSTLALYQHPSMGAVVMDINGQYQLVNEAAAAFLGMPRKELIGEFHREVFPHAPLQDSGDERPGQEWICYSERRPSASSLPAADCWDISITLRRDREGFPCGYLMLIQEVSSFRLALQEAARQRQLCCTLLEEVPAGVIIAQGYDGRITMINATARQLHGEGLVTGSQIALESSRWKMTGVTGEPLATETHPLLATIRSGMRLRGETVRLATPDGRCVTLLMDCASLGIWDGEPAAIAVFQDISWRIEHELELEVQNRRLQELDHAKDDFLANVSHELKSPLTAILGWVGIAREMGNPALLAQALEVIERNAKRQAWMVEGSIDIK